MLLLPLLLYATFVLLFAAGMYALAPTTRSEAPTEEKSGDNWVSLKCAGCGADAIAWQNHWWFPLPRVRKEIVCNTCKKHR